MQVLIDWVLAHSAFIILVVYEIWSLIPSNIIKSSSILTWIGAFIKNLKDKNQGL